MGVFNALLPYGVFTIKAWGGGNQIQGGALFCHSIQGVLRILSLELGGGAPIFVTPETQSQINKTH